MSETQEQTLGLLKPLLSEWQDECHITIWQDAIEFIYYGRCPCCDKEDHEVCNRVDIATWDRTIPAQWAEYMDDNFGKEG